MLKGVAGPANHLLSAYPSIFSPRFFDNIGGELIGKEQRDLVLIDHVDEDFPLAAWLTRRLELAGYNVCCNGMSPYAGLNRDAAIRGLIERRAASHLAILSPTGRADGDLRGRCEVSASIENCLLPLQPTSEAVPPLSSRVEGIDVISFENGWVLGLDTLLRHFQKHDVPQSWDIESGRAMALGSLIPEPLTTENAETLYSNAFPVLSLPESVLSVPLRRKPNPLQLQQLRENWAFVLVGQRALSFHYPPGHDLVDSRQRFAEALISCTDPDSRETHFAGRHPRHVVTELVRRCLEAACYRAGLMWCPDRELIYFPVEDQDSRRISYVDVNGKNRNTGVTGKKSLFRPGPQPNEVYRYQIAPKFFASGSSEADSWEVRLRLAIRVTDEAGTPHSGRAVIGAERMPRRDGTTSTGSPRRLLRSSTSVGMVSSKSVPEIDCLQSARRPSLGPARCPSTRVRSSE